MLKRYRKQLLICKRRSPRFSDIFILLNIIIVFVIAPFYIEIKLFFRSAQEKDDAILDEESEEEDEQELVETADLHKGEDQWEISREVSLYDLEGPKTKTDSECCNDNFQKNDMLLFDDKDEEEDEDDIDKYFKGI